MRAWQFTPFLWALSTCAYAAPFAAVDTKRLPDSETTRATAPQSGAGEAPSALPLFRPDRDLLALHYDHAPDKDDGHSAAADRTVLESLHGADWIRERVLAVSGTYGRNKATFDKASDKVMDVTWGERGGWVAADRDWEGAVRQVLERWAQTLLAGGDVHVKEGGQSDLTCEVVKRLAARLPDVNLRQRIHVVQHSDWNEKQTTPQALEFTKASTDYVRIRDANRYLNVQGGNKAFERAALTHSIFGPSWTAAFDYYSPRQRLDFSDTGELFHILGLGELSIDAVRERFLD